MRFCKKGDRLFDPMDKHAVKVVKDDETVAPAIFDSKFRQKGAAYTRVFTVR